MAMKKRVLPALMAGMVVIGSTGLANAADSDRKEIIQNIGETSSTTVHITGTVDNNKGQAPAGKLIVELPTKLAFSVDKSGGFKGATYQVDNKGQDAIAVSVSEFKEVGGDGNISLRSSVEDTALRGTVKLDLVGNTNTVNLLPSQTPEKEILVLDGGKSGSITLTGKSGKQPNPKVDQNGSVGEYTMIFKVSKYEPSASAPSGGK